MLGVLAFPLIILSFCGGIFIFHTMKTLFNIPLILNLPGAFVFMGALFSFVVWVIDKIGVIKQSMTFAPEPLTLNLPWYTWLLYLGLSVIYYATIVRLLFIWRTDIRPGKKWA